MNGQEKKKREKQSYDTKGGARSYGSLWDQDSLNTLYELSATPAWENLLEDYAEERAGHRVWWRSPRRKVTTS